MPPMQYKATSNRGYGVGNARLGLSGRRRISMGVPVMFWLGERIQFIESLKQDFHIKGSDGEI